MSDSGIIVFKLKGVSQLVPGKLYYSKPEDIGRIPWRLCVKINKAPDNSNTVRINMNGALYNFEDKSYVVKFKAKLVNQLKESGIADIVEQAAKIFPDPINGYKVFGTELIIYSLLDPKSGWVVDDTMLITCELDVERVRLSDTIEREFNFPFSGVNRMPLGRGYFSEPVTVMGIRWRVAAQAKMVEEEKYLRRFFQGVKADFKGRRFYVAYKAEPVSPSESNPDLREVPWTCRIYPDPMDGAVCTSSRTLIKFSDLDNPANDLVVNDTMFIRCKFSVIEIIEIRDDVGS